LNPSASNIGWPFQKHNKIRQMKSGAQLFGIMKHRLKLVSTDKLVMRAMIQCLATKSQRGSIVHRECTILWSNNSLKKSRISTLFRLPHTNFSTFYASLHYHTGNSDRQIWVTWPTHVVDIQISILIAQCGRVVGMWSHPKKKGRTTLVWEPSKFLAWPVWPSNHFLNLSWAWLMPCGTIYM